MNSTLVHSTLVYSSYCFAPYLSCRGSARVVVIRAKAPSWVSEVRVGSPSNSCANTHVRTEIGAPCCKD
jgi:hypothetical protein